MWYNSVHDLVLLARHASLLIAVDLNYCLHTVHSLQVLSVRLEVGTVCVEA